MENTESNFTQVESAEEEQSVNDGLGVLIKRKTLYRGSGFGGLQKFDPARETTIGNGVYFTSGQEEAKGYARGRHRNLKSYGSEQPVLYKCEVNDIKLLDLRTKINIQKILPGFKKLLQEKLANSNGNSQWWQEEMPREIIRKIDSGEISNFELLTHVQDWLVEYVKSLGYEGLITLEGGEGDYVGNHDTYLIFDSEKVKVISESAVS